MNRVYGGQANVSMTPFACGSLFEALVRSLPRLAIGFVMLAGILSHPISAQAYSNTDTQKPAPPPNSQVSPFGPLESSLHQNFMKPDLSAFRDFAGQVVGLLEYIQSVIDANPIDPQNPSVTKYNRPVHFGGWLHQQEGNCLDTRGLVLSRDADPSEPLEVRDGTCRINKGLWHDPYTGTDFRLASAVQIDHVVPLRNAYYAGAYGWSPQRRCHYSNFIGNAYHLLTVSGRENMIKGDKSPERYMPPSRAYTCRYISLWMRIKAIWNLHVTPEEAAGLAQLAQMNDCRRNELTMDAAELEEQRRLTQATIQSCANFGNQDPYAPPSQPAPDRARRPTGSRPGQAPGDDPGHGEDPHDPWSWGSETWQTYFQKRAS